MLRRSTLNAFLPSFVLTTRCGTVMDFVVAMMLDLSQAVTSVQVRKIFKEIYDRKILSEALTKNI